MNEYLNHFLAVRNIRASAALGELVCTERKYVLVLQTKRKSIYS